MNIITYKSGYKYQLKGDYHLTATGIEPEEAIDLDYIRLTKKGDLLLKSGYAWDGPSGPAIDTRNFMRASLVHDAFYQLMREGHLAASRFRDKADRLLQKICLEDGMSFIRALWVYYGVKWFARSAASTQRRKPIIYAPFAPVETLDGKSF